MTVGDLRVHVQTLPAAGARRGTVLLVHGLLTDSLASWYFTLAPSLAAAGHDVVMYDSRGHGRTSRPASGYRLADFVDDAEGLLDVLAVREPVHVVGNSFGGTVAYALAGRSPDRVASVLAIESEPATPAWARKMAQILGWAQDGLVRDDVLLAVDAEHGRHTGRLARSAGRLLAETALAAELPASDVWSEADLAAVRCPVLAVFGDESDLAAQAPWHEAHLPDCRSTLVAGQQHSVLVEASEQVRGLTAAWLSEVDATPRQAAAG
ncbi:MAG: hydrolase [Frankiales bacterium]|nr:hydrolase [Frankiales bacterium]